MGYSPGSHKESDTTKRLSTHTASSVQFSSVQSLSCVRLCDPVNRSTPGLPVHHLLPDFSILSFCFFILFMG